MSYQTYPFTPDLFLKAIRVKDGRLKFTHRGKPFDLTSPCLKELEGLTVLVNTGRRNLPERQKDWRRRVG